MLALRPLPIPSLELFQASSYFFHFIFSFIFCVLGHLSFSFSSSRLLSFCNGHYLRTCFYHLAYIRLWRLNNSFPYHFIDAPWLHHHGRMAHQNLFHHFHSGFSPLASLSDDLYPIFWCVACQAWYWQEILVIPTQPFPMYLVWLARRGTGNCGSRLSSCSHALPPSSPFSTADHSFSLQCKYFPFLEK